ncbi:hypothetical protein GALL_300830 [mine drainage metagenome]|uniref:Uncharacterized protein n=1 Tax=mine drainage metagenome TaxID=410659 RepID=A0A1J5REG5_9ZZZZ
MISFLRTYFAIVAVALGLIAAYTYAVDPYATFRWHDLAGFNDRKMLKRDGGRVSKALIVGRVPFDVLFFGTSAAETGLDPASPQLQGASAFNFGLSAGTVLELASAMRFSARHQHPKLVLIDLDPVLFWSARTYSGDYDQSRLAGASQWPVMFKRLLSSQALKDSYGVMRASMRHKPTPFPKTGFHNQALDTARFEHFRSTFEAMLQSYQPFWSHYPADYARDRLDLLRQAVIGMADRQARVILFVGPFHVRHIQQIASLGHLTDLENWKRDLTRLVAEVNTVPGRNAQLWDFSGPSSITEEPLPPQEQGRMRHYWDPIHYSQSTGNLIMARVLGHDAGVPADFGVRLTPQDIDSVLSAERRALAEETARHPDWHAVDPAGHAP